MFSTNLSEIDIRLNLVAKFIDSHDSEAIRYCHFTMPIVSKMLNDAVLEYYNSNSKENPDLVSQLNILFNKYEDIIFSNVI